MKKIKYGIVGLGNIGRDGHLPCLEQIDDIEIVAVADTHEGNLKKFEDKNKNKRTKYFSNYKDILKLDEVDAMLIATPDNTHVDMVLDSFEAGKHVLSEKPAATTLDDLRRLEKAVNSTDKIYQVGLELRYLPLFQRMKNTITQGTLGNPYMIWCKEFRGPFWKKVDNWIMFNDKTGGVFVEKTCHYFDLMTWFAGSTPKKVVAVADQNVVKEIYGVKPDVFDNGWVIVEYENGVKATLGLCMFCKCEREVELGVIGDKAMMEGYMRKQQIELCEYEDGAQINIDLKASNNKENLSHGGGVYYEHRAFIDNIRNNRTPLTDINVAKWSVLVGLAAEESARNGSKPVTF